MSLQFDGFLSRKFQNSNFTKVEIFFKKVTIQNLVNERNHGFGFETEETKVVSVSTETNFGFLLTETH